ncbi:phosphate ABC transporter permease subunit PstC [Maritimibacter fusiformis]|uniref:Phosphate transport system permease protein n=1 Tax=Maritimibacter fusiformis TaxID=2603819 RepID=A0A5D0RI53_9RHOB|nr:phosphate ABC transporter permease subunit PstC [Maritimibacter fusiformis]TYB81123.1 phosphate ABC transporter permease subunit PstC [Maritimibacter fusiformis]
MWILDAIFSLPVLVVGLAILGYVAATARAHATAGSNFGTLAAQPRAHGTNAFFSVLIPAVGSFAALSLVRSIGLRQGVETLSVRSIFWLVLSVAAIGCIDAILRSSAGFRARVASEAWIKSLLIAASAIAILTTIGILWSMLFEATQFFRQYDWRDFLFSTDWAPNFRGNSALGILPLLWGTLYVSFIALAFAVPVGLFAAIYLSEYAGQRMRSVAKPMIEILAGIPTIVYGLFALITVGPLLRDHFAQPLGLGDSASSVMTAGLVMGIMLIPFVSSLSDDIINSVPQAMRDGSLALGATRSETIRNVVIPAALPGIVGAILLAAGRAIGETMIVVLGAGAAARLSLNPFEAMTTITVKIVSQLTGDTEFASPETLVAFALGLTLFVLTLGLNVLALVIVRKYREHYE